MKQPLVIDRLAALWQKPEGNAVLEPGLVIAAVLSTLRWAPGQMHGPNDRVVSLIMSGLKQAGWKIVPIKEDANHD